MELDVVNFLNSNLKMKIDCKWFLVKILAKGRVCLKFQAYMSTYGRKAFFAKKYFNLIQILILAIST